MEKIMTPSTAAGRISRSSLAQFLLKKTLVIAIIFAGCFGWSLSQEEGQKIDFSQMEALEELTESLANHLLEL